jgi:hypothetical protein
MQPQYLSSSYRCGKGGFWINVLRLILIIPKDLSDFNKFNCLKSDKSKVNNCFKDLGFFIPL